MGRRRSGGVGREHRRCRLGVYFNRNAPGHQQPKVFEAADEVGCSVSSSSASATSVMRKSVVGSTSSSLHVSPTFTVARREEGEPQPMFTGVPRVQRRMYRRKVGVVPTLFVPCLPAPFYSLPFLSLPLAGQPTASSSTYLHHLQRGSQAYHTPNLLWDTSTNDNASRPLFMYIYHPSMHIPFPSSPFPLPSFQTPFSSPAHASSTLTLQFLYDPSLYLHSNAIPVLLRTIYHVHFQP